MKVSRAHLKKACDHRDWDLLDKLLELDNSNINDASLYTDTWGEWWGMLLECVYKNHVDGVKVLLKHGAKKSVGNWGDCIPTTPEEEAQSKPEILQLLKSKKRPEYIRKREPNIDFIETEEDKKVNLQGEIRDQTGLVFQVDAFDSSGS